VVSLLDFFYVVHMHTPQTFEFCDRVCRAHLSVQWLAMCSPSWRTRSSATTLSSRSEVNAAHYPRGASAHDCLAACLGACSLAMVRMPRTWKESDQPALRALEAHN
jgi:hypothetical protein